MSQMSQKVWIPGQMTRFSKSNFDSTRLVGSPVPTLEVSWSPKLLNPPFTTTVGLQPVRSGPAWTSPGPGLVRSTVRTDSLLVRPSPDQQPPSPDQTDWHIKYLV